MTSDSSSFREGLVWAREANGCVSHTCSVPFTAWTRENVSVREEASFSGALARFVPDGRHCSEHVSCRLPVIIYQWSIFMCTPCTLPSTPVPLSPDPPGVLHLIYTTRADKRGSR